MYLTKNNRAWYLPTPPEPPQEPDGIPQRWDFVEMSKFLGLDTGHVKEYHHLYRTTSYPLFLRADLAYVCRHHPQDLFTLTNEIDLITLCQGIALGSQGPDFESCLYDHYGMQDLISQRLVYHEWREPNVAPSMRTLRDQAAYATINEAEGVIEGVKPRETIALPKYNKTGYLGYSCHNDRRKFARQLRDLHDRCNIPVLKDRRTGHWEPQGGYNWRKTSRSYPACYRKEILHILMYIENEADDRFPSDIGHPGFQHEAKTRLLEDCHSLNDIEALAAELGLYSRYYPYIERQFL